MIIDSHVHLKHGDAAGTEYPAQEIVRIMDAAGIDRAVVFAMSTTTRRSMEMAEEVVCRFPGRLIPYAYALPNYERPALKELEEAVSQRGFRGIKIHAGECTLGEHVVDPVLELAATHDVPCLIDFCGNLAAAERLARRFPETKIIAAHLGRYLTADEQLMDRFIELSAAHDNVYLDVSGVAKPEKIRDAVRRVGSSRVIWGSDGPQKAPDTVTFIQNELGRVKALNLSASQEAEVLGRNIARLLKIAT